MIDSLRRRKGEDRHHRLTGRLTNPAQIVVARTWSGAGRFMQCWRQQLHLKLRQHFISSFEMEEIVWVECLGLCWKGC